MVKTADAGAKIEVVSKQELPSCHPTSESSVCGPKENHFDFVVF